MSKPRRAILPEEMDQMLPLKLELPGWAIDGIDKVADRTGSHRATLLRIWLIDRLQVEQQALALDSKPKKKAVGA